MRNIFLLLPGLLFLSFAFISCLDSQAVSETGERQDTLAGTENEDATFVSDNLFSDLPILKEWLKSYPEIEEGIQEYLKELNSEIKTEDQIKKILALRDSVIIDMEEPLIMYFEGGGQGELTYEVLEKLDMELKSIGILCVYAEGMMLALERAEILTDEIEKIASDPYRLYLKFKQAAANSQGGEYPFMDLTYNVDVIKYGEYLIEKYPESAYSKEIKDLFSTNLSFFTDFHIVKSEEMIDYFYSGITTEYYPYVSSKENFEAFVEKASESKYAEVVKRILDNPSEIEITGGTFDIIYVVMTDIAANHSELKNMIFDYLEDKNDIPHSINLTENGEEKLIVAYRFYTDLVKAEKALEIIKKIKPGARIIKVNANHEIVE